MNCTEFSNRVFSKVAFGKMQSDLLRRLGKTKVIHIQRREEELDKDLKFLSIVNLRYDTG